MVDALSLIKWKELLATQEVVVIPQLVTPIGNLAMTLNGVNEAGNLIGFLDLERTAELNTASEETQPQIMKEISTVLKLKNARIKIELNPISGTVTRTIITQKAQD